ncbi:tripartite ATP-independent transporter solute receptor, DctP family [Lentibacillus halodurans]|uniref:Tripartite ATP-independent transporter solute receptor, DctP family n=1 Tax=Lentibacillus halodurans TaxID=237679 RepID=A0A1I0X1J5_9BACI|nr:TRAP transporter substrate-binding protein [Lentibacillus halodurans]SFA93983.1 tripartite ATP-independent transporter solute receptor, DctP family [Lentibacillus halodurans]
MKKLILGIIVSLVFLAACGDEESSSDDGSSNETFSITYSTWANEGEPAYLGMERFKEIVEEETDNNIEVELHPGNQLGSTVEQMEQVKLGTIEMMSSGDPGMDEIEYLSLPYLMDSNDHWTAVLQSDIGEEWNNQLINEQGVRNIGTLPRGPRVISSNIEVNEPEDLEGMKIRTPAVDYYVQTFEALGANPTPMDFGEVYSGLQSGVVEGQENPLETIYSAGLHEVQDYVINSNHMYKPAFVTINEEFFQSLPEDYQEILLDAAEEAQAHAQEELEANEEEMIADMEENGVGFIEPDVEAFEKATQSVRDELGTEIWGEETYNEIVEIGQSELE